MFKEKKTIEVCKNVLLTWSLANKNLGYRQGMNELVGIFFIIYQDQQKAIDERRAGLSADYLELHNVKFVEHDIFTMLDLIFYTGLEQLYVHEDSIKKAKKATGDNQRIFGQVTEDYNYKNVKLPIVKKAAHILNVKLKEIDSELQFHLESIKLEPQWFMM